MTPDELRTWYEIIKRLDSAKGCDSEFRVTDILEDESGSTERVVGQYDPVANTISVINEYNPYENIATIMHEVAHVVCNHRHSRVHGYSWRRKFIQLAIELAGVNPTALAKSYRKTHAGLNRREALDAAVVYIVTTNYYYIDLHVYRKYPTLHKCLINGWDSSAYIDGLEQMQKIA